MKNIRFDGKAYWRLLHCGVNYPHYRLCGMENVNNLDGNLVEISEVRLPSIENLLLMSWQLEEITKIQRTLLNPNLELNTRKQQYQELDSAKNRFKRAWKTYEPLPQRPKKPSFGKNSWPPGKRSKTDRTLS
jgi:hypothetical protein